jgi:hypothetical protein
MTHIAQAARARRDAGPRSNVAFNLHAARPRPADAVVTS